MRARGRWLSVWWGVRSWCWGKWVGARDFGLYAWRGTWSGFWGGWFGIVDYEFFVEGEGEMVFCWQGFRDVGMFYLSFGRLLQGYTRLTIPSYHMLTRRNVALLVHRPPQLHQRIQFPLLAQPPIILPHRAPLQNLRIHEPIMHLLHIQLQRWS